MAIALLTKLAQKQHDSLVGLYIDYENRALQQRQRAAKAEASEKPIKEMVEIYERLLIDPLVTTKITTTRVAEAIASLQLYLSRITQQLEPGLAATHDEVEQWQNWQHRYALWAGLRKLESHAENYIDPILRQRQTPQFEELQQKLQQGKLNDGLIQKAVLEYLKNFESISSLAIDSAFQVGESTSQAQGDYKTALFWFIGHTRTEPKTYYIRSLNLRETQGNETAPSLHAWGDWEKIDLPFGNIAVSGGIRPVQHEGRLYIAWFENKEIRDDDNNPQTNTLLRMALQQLDKTWSVCFEHEFVGFKADFLAACTYTTVAKPETDTTPAIPSYKNLCLTLANTDGNPIGTNTAAEGIIFKDLLNYNVVSGDEAKKRIGSFYSFNNQGHNWEVQRDVAELRYPDRCGLVRQNANNSSGENTHEDEKVDSAAIIRYMATPLDTNNQPHCYVLASYFPQKMIPYAQQGLEELFSWEVQNMVEPPLYGPADPARPDTQPQKIDFKGAYGRHFCELFLHLPWLVANIYTEQGNFIAAQEWHNRLFTPQKKNGRFFQVRVLEEAQESARRQAPDDADSIALSNPEIYCKALFYNYIRFLMARGDALYRELSRDSLNEAKQYYMQAISLLGEDPQQASAQRWLPIRLSTLATTPNRDLRLLEESFNQPLEPLQTSDHASTSRDGLFREPQNSLLKEQWEALQTRLYNLRNLLTLDGKPMSLPLYDTPIDPADLQQRLANGQNLNSASGQNAVVVPPFRYAVMHERTMRAVESLIQFGNGLQNALERKDGLDLEKLQLTQQKGLLNYTLDLQQQAIEMGKHSLEALYKSKEAAKERYNHYNQLHEGDFISDEQAALDAANRARKLNISAVSFHSLGAAASFIPTIFGFTYGWPGLSNSMFNMGMALSAGSSIAMSESDISRLNADLQRRKQEWKLQYTLAEKDGEQIDSQIKAQEQQNKQYQKQLEQTRRQGEQIGELLDFWSGRVTNAQLYQWMINQLRQLFYRAWDATVSLCHATEAAWRCDTGWFTEPSLLRNTGWSDAHHGLLCGETLKLALQQMEQKYLLRHQRHLEITHTVSLKSLLEQQPAGTGSETQWDVLQRNIAAIVAPNSSIETLKVPFTLNEKLFAERHPGHYQRRLVQLSLSIPAVIGPYQNVNAQLTQTDSHFLLTPSVDACKALATGDTNHPAIHKNLRASQQVVLSSGFEDGGLFFDNMGDERYLPFEGNGVHSGWELQFPNVTRSEQKQLLSRMTDVIIRIRYRALDGGERFASDVLKALKDDSAS